MNEIRPYKEQDSEKASVDLVVENVRSEMKYGEVVGYDLPHRTGSYQRL